MLSAQGKNGLITAWSAEKEDGPFICPGCKQGAILKKGYIKSPHFAHAPGEQCPYWEYHQGESPLHLRAKKEIYEALSAHPQVSRLRLERYLGPVRPDISFFLGDVPIAIEMQVSSISPDIISRRTKEYARRGIAILWLSPYEETSIKDGQPYMIRAWERYIHGLYQKTFYYWIEGEELLPVHFEEYTPSVQEKNFYPLPSLVHRVRCDEPIGITQLETISLYIEHTGENISRGVKLWCKPEIWVPDAQAYLSMREAQQRYPYRYPQPHLIMRPPDEVPFSGDPFNENFLPPISEDSPEVLAGRCLTHNRIYRYSDGLGGRYCSDAECWSRFRLLLAGTARGYPELSGITDPRNYLPDLTAEPRYLPTPLGDRLIPVYPARPLRRAVLIEAGEANWRTFVAEQHYQKIARALTALEREHDAAMSPVAEQSS